MTEATTGFDPYALLAGSRLGVLATIKKNGLPQLSPITPYYDREASTIYVSMTEGRAKTANLRRDPRAALEVTSSDGWSWATAEGSVTLTGPGADPDGPEVQALVDQLLAHWIQFREGQHARPERRPVTPGTLGLRRRQQDEHDDHGSRRGLSGSWRRRPVRPSAP